MPDYPPEVYEEIRIARIEKFQAMLHNWGQNWLGVTLPEPDGTNDLLVRNMVELLRLGSGAQQGSNLLTAAGRELAAGSLAFALRTFGWMENTFCLGLGITTYFFLRDKAMDIANNFMNIDFDAIRGYLNAVQTPRLLQYKNMFDNGYIDEGEFFAWSGCRNWVDFYERVGVDPNASRLRTMRENGSINDQQLKSGLRLQTDAQVNKLFGMQWRVALDIKDTMSEANVNFIDVYNSVGKFCSELKTSTSEDLIAMQDLADLIIANDALPLNFGDIIQGIDKHIAVADETQHSYEFVPSSQSFSLAFSALIDATDPEKMQSKKGVTFNEPVNADIIQSNIALAMRQVEDTKIGVGDFSFEGVSSSFQTISFASPFEDVSLAKTQNRVA